MDNDKIASIYTRLLKIHHAMNANLSEQAKQLDLNVSEYIVMLDIIEYPNTDLLSVCSRLGMKKSTASKTIQKLIDLGHIEREADPYDNRKIRLTPVESDEKLFCKTSAIHQTFAGYNINPCNLETIDNALEDVIKMLAR